MPSAGTASSTGSTPSTRSTPSAGSGTASRSGRGRRIPSTDTGPPPAPLDVRLVPAAMLGWAGAFHAVTARPAVALGGAAGCLAMAALAVHHLRREHRRRPAARHRAVSRTPPAGALLLVALVVAAVLGSAGGQVHARSSGLLAELTTLGASALLTGRVAEEPRAVAAREWETAGRFRVTLTVSEVSGRGRVSTADAPVVVLGPAPWAALSLGEQVRVRGTPLATPPGDKAVALLTTDRHPERTARPPWHLRVVGGLRADLLAVTEDLSPQGRGLVPGIAVGDDRRLPADLEDDMRATSLTHLTAVSGAHVAIVLGAVLGAGVWLPRRARVTVGALALVAFVALVRPEPSVIRSAVMGGVVLAALLLGRPARALPGLCAAVVALLVLDPWLARSFGFALSVLATAGLVVLARPWARWLSHALPRWLATVVAVPAAAQAACAPVVLLLTPAISVYAIPANVMAAPVVPPATVLGVGATLVAPWWAAGAEAMVSAASVCTAWIALAARTFADLPGAQVTWPGTVAGSLLLAVLTAGAIAVLARAGPPRAGPWLPVSALVLVLLVVPGPRQALSGILPGTGPAEGWVAVQCDVGQGGAFLLRSGAASAVLVDVGGAGSGATECLRDAGVERLDLLVLTHPHADHVGGLPEVLAAVEVEQVLVSPAARPADTVAAVSGQLAAAGAEVLVATSDGARSDGVAGAVAWEVLWPTDEAAGTLPPDAVNDRSVVVRLDAPGLSAVALGDVELDGQAALVRALRDERAPTPEVVVMAHHGSPRQDPALAAALAPRLTLVSVGADNDYGHPAPSAVDLYAPSGPVLRTDECGPITVVRSDAGLATVADCDR
ncbi:ComEC/Rec2 family competence protein [Georgenia halophila]|uniref:ComEC/Rec2 family competence protein n=2 Tax=Georgenia halophila TaxID=620889 RepID=A0ABP8LMG8_9MICO